MHRSWPRAAGEADRSTVSRAVYELIPEGQSSFTVEVPLSFCSGEVWPGQPRKHREFYFSDLTIVPGYFSEKAFQLGVESDSGERRAGGPSLDYELRYEIASKKNVYFDATTGMLQDKFQQPRGRALDLEVLVSSINEFFENTKPADAASLPFFIDWVDFSWLETVTSSVLQPTEETEGAAASAATAESSSEDEYGDATEVAPAELARERRQAGDEEEVEARYVEPWTFEYFDYYVRTFAEYYYEGAYSQEEHYNALPLSARTLPGINNYRLPKDVEQVENLRLRIHVAPMTLVHFTNNLLLQDLGFTQKMYGPMVNRGFAVKNNSASGYLTLVAEWPPKPTVLPLKPTTFYCKPLRALYHSPPVMLSVTQEKFGSNESMLQLMQGALEKLNAWTNVRARVSYTATDKKYVFTFPDNRVSVKLLCDSRLAERLGYGLSQSISSGSVPGAAEVKNAKIDADGLSRALVWDTVMAAVSLENSSSLAAFGFDGPLLATLMPENPGVLALRRSEAGLEGTEAVRAPTVQSGQSSVPLKFRVWTFRKNSSIVPLNWPVHCFAAGVLRGRLES